jgi:hypothetical protein
VNLELLLSQAGDGGFERGLLDIAEDDLHAFLGEAGGHGQADAACPAGYDGDLTFEIKHG